MEVVSVPTVMSPVPPSRHRGCSRFRISYWRVFSGSVLLFSKIQSEQSLEPKEMVTSDQAAKRKRLRSYVLQQTPRRDSATWIFGNDWFSVCYKMMCGFPSKKRSIIHAQIKWCLIINVLRVCPWRRPATVDSHSMVPRQLSWNARMEGATWICRTGAGGRQQRPGVKSNRDIGGESDVPTTESRHPVFRPAIPVLVVTRCSEYVSLCTP